MTLENNEMRTNPVRKIVSVVIGGFLRCASGSRLPAPRYKKLPDMNDNASTKE